MGTNHGNPLPDGLEQEATGFIGRGQRLERTENQRMMGEQDLGPELPGRAQGRFGGIEADQYPIDFGGRVPDLEPYIIPVFGQSRMIETVEQTDEILKTDDAFLFHNPEEGGRKKESATSVWLHSR